MQFKDTGLNSALFVSGLYLSYRELRKMKFPTTNSDRIYNISVFLCKHSVINKPFLKIFSLLFLRIAFYTLEIRKKERKIR